jgi:tRNA dimethylallyltransferase
MPSSLIVLLGPTASGKTALAVDLAKRLDGEIISADSRQIYKGLDIGTGKDLLEYGDVPYHLIDNHVLGDHYSVAHFQKEAIDAIQEVLRRGKQPILCGGTGLYIEALLANYSFSHLPHFLDKPIALDLTYRVFGLNPEVSLRRARISARFQARLAEGLIEEVEGLLAQGAAEDDFIRLGLEYKWIVMYLRGEVSRERFEEGLEVAIHQFAKRQMTYFRKMEKAGILISWIPDTLDFQGKSDFVLKNI